MLLPSPNRRSVARTTGMSVAVHALVLVLLYGVLHRRPLQVFNLPGAPSGTHLDVVYLPGSAAIPAPQTKTKIHPAMHPTAASLRPIPSPLPSIVPAPSLPIPPRPHLTFTAPAPDTPSPPSTVADASAGSDSFGSGDIQIAFTTYSPSPAPDLSLLPHGTQGDVVLDVTIDSNGKVADTEVLKTPGYGIESSVIRTVRTWTFRPATKDGVPIASVQELHFHYGPA